MIRVIENNSVYEITFPYDSEIVERIKKVPTRDYIPNSKKWIIPKDMLGHLLSQFKGTKFESEIQIISSESINQDACLEPTANIPDVNISNVKIYVASGMQLYNHQKDFIKFALYRQLYEHNMSGFLLCDSPGLGKTIQVTNLALYNRRNNKFKHCLVITCIASAKYNWIDDIRKHTNGKFHPYILGARKKRDGTISNEQSNINRLYDLETETCYGTDTRLPYFLIVNVEMLRYKQGKSYVIADQLIKMINSGSLNMIIIDEVHKNLSPQSSQGKQVIRIKKATKSKCMWLPMTGTPIVNRPTDVFLPLLLTDSIPTMSFSSWCMNYCISGDYGCTDVIGYKNINTLKAILQSNMLRRHKEDVLDLPPIIFNDIYVDLSSYQHKMYEDFRKGIVKDKEKILQMLNPLAMMLRLRQVCGSPELVDDELCVDDKYLNKNAKLRELIRIVSEIRERNEKVIIFSSWVKPLYTLYRFINSLYPNSICEFHGGLTESERNISKLKFQTDDNVSILLGTIAAAGVSHTFTAAQNVIFYDEPFTYADKQQAWERAHRIGTTSSVNVYTLLTRDTIEEKVHNIIYNKRDMSNFIVDNIDIRSNPELFDMLLSK